MNKNELVVKFYNSLKKIAKGYQTPDQLRKNSEKQYGLGYEESLEMAYENLQAEASSAIKGVRISSLSKPEAPANGKISQKQINEWKKKAEKWDALDKKISSYYPEDSEGHEGGDLADIGEAAAIAFGWM